MYFKCLFRRSWGSEIKSNYKFNGNKFALFHSYLVFTRRPPPPAGSWKQVTREIKRYFIAIEYTYSYDLISEPQERRNKHLKYTFSELKIRNFQIPQKLLMLKFTIIYKF